MRSLRKLWSWLNGASLRSSSVKLRPRAALRLEQLDERIVPAGNITAVVENGSLIITGDGEDNSFEIRNFLNDIRLVSLNGTAINGSVGLEDISGVFKDVVINLKGGDDLVQLNGGGVNAAVISRDLIFNGGGGADTLIGEPDAVIGRDLIFNGGNGISSSTLDDIFIGRNAILTGNGDVQLDSVAGAGTTIHGVLRVESLGSVEVELEDTEMGRFRVIAADQANVELSSVNVGGKARISGGTGADNIDIDLSSQVLGSLLIETQSGNDTVQLNAEIGGDASILLGLGTNQNVDIDSSTIYGKLRVVSEGSGTNNWTFDGVDVIGNTVLLSGDGNDTVLFNDGEFFGKMTFVGGDGNDEVQISDGNSVTFRGTSLFDLGLGNDTLQLGQGLGDANFLSLVTLDGGAGSNTLIDIGGDFSVTPVIVNF